MVTINGKSIPLLVKTNGSQKGLLIAFPRLLKELDLEVGTAYDVAATPASREDMADWAEATNDTALRLTVSTLRAVSDGTSRIQSQTTRIQEKTEEMLATAKALQEEANAANESAKVARKRTLVLGLLGGLFSLFVTFATWAYTLNDVKVEALALIARSTADEAMPSP